MLKLFENRIIQRIKELTASVEDIKAGMESAKLFMGTLKKAKTPRPIHDLGPRGTKSKQQKIEMPLDIISKHTSKRGNPFSYH